MFDMQPNLDKTVKHSIAMIEPFKSLNPFNLLFSLMPSVWVQRRGSIFQSDGRIQTEGQSTRSWLLKQGQD